MRLSAVDHLLVFLLEGGGSYFTRMLALGFTEDEIGKAWDEARGAVLHEAKSPNSILGRTIDWVEFSDAVIGKALVQGLEPSVEGVKRDRLADVVWLWLCRGSSELRRLTHPARAQPAERRKASLL